VDRPHRLDVRYAIRFPAQLSVGKRTLSLLTADVSYGGIYLCTDAPPPLHQLVSVKLVLPVGDHALNVHGMTVHVVEPESAKGRVPGIGVQFYALDQAVRDSWDTFIRHVEEHCPKSPDQTPLRLPRGFTPEPIRRRFERHTAVLKVEPTTQSELDEIYTRDVLTGSMTIPTRLELPTGTRVVVYVAHPTSGQPFLFEASVVYQASDPPALGLELLGIDHRCKEAFLDFVRAGILIGEEVVEASD
jgi:Tfp pilus assembly protein PilZ